VAGLGGEVMDLDVGDTVAMGTVARSCGHCPACKSGLEIYCEEGFVPTYNGHDSHLDVPTFGGYSASIVVDRRYVLTVPDDADLAATVPLLCAGITTYSPLRHWGTGPGKRVGIVGIGGLGHVAVKLAHAMGAEVVVFTSSQTKVDTG
jgi:uncharacterized zinc-type alcohol dehydrogenase-like protein